jgi:hypothetical protein
LTAWSYYLFSLTHGVNFQRKKTKEVFNFRGLTQAVIIIIIWNMLCKRRRNEHVVEGVAACGVGHTFLLCRERASL